MYSTAIATAWTRARNMPGETHLDTLLATMAPVLAPDRVIFCSLPDGTPYEHLSPLAMIREHEGISLIITEAVARQHGIVYTSTYQAITLTVHSSLDAVGLTAAVSTRLAAAGISANMVAGYYHDHVFIPSEQAEKALAILQQHQDSTDS